MASATRTPSDLGMNRPPQSQIRIFRKKALSLLLGASERAWVSAHRDPVSGRPGLRWEHGHTGERATAMGPMIERAEELQRRIRSFLRGDSEEFACRLLGTCLFQVLDSGNPALANACFKPVEDFLASQAAAARRASDPGHLGSARESRGRWSWPVRFSVALAALLGMGLAWARVDSVRSAAIPAQLEVVHDAGPGAEEMVVVVRGFMTDRRTMEGILRVIQEQRPKADLLFFNFPSTTFSNRDPFALASELEAAIAERDRTNRYQRILISGHGMGALLVRKAYLYGCGSVEDLNFAGDAATSRPPHNWVSKVDRIVLLAGLNRGWDLDGRTTGRDWYQTGLHRLDLMLARLTGTGRFIRSFARGEPFVANLRLQWLATLEKARSRKDGPHPPVVVQVLGDRDDVVSPDDSRDVRVAQEFLWVGVNNTGHWDLLDVGDSGDGLERKRKIQAAFGGEEHLAELERANPKAASDMDPKVTTVVFVLHGIRDMGAWTSEFMKPLQSGFAELHPGSGDKIYVHRAAYGYFPMGSFLLFGDRQRNVRWFMDQVTELRARFPNLKEIHFIGHSNGTEVLASALATYRTLKVGRVVFAGSVVRRDFEWSRYSGRIGQVRNYVASSDWVVALFPRLFEIPGFRSLNPDLGSAGYNGFEDGFVKNGETQFIAGGHKAALDPRNIRSIVAFILKGERVDVDELIVSKHPPLLDYASRLCWVIWLALFGTVGWVGWRLPTWVARVWARVGGDSADSLRGITWLSRAAFVGLILMLLVTV